MRKVLTTLVFCLTAFIAVPADSTKPPVFQMRLVFDKPTDDSEQMAEQVKKAKDSEETFPVVVNVQKKVLLDETDVKSAKAKMLGIYHLVEIDLTTAGQEKLATITRQHIGDSLVIIIEGKIVVILKFDAEQTDGKLEFMSRFMSEQDAEKMVNEVNSAVSK
jgi:preprotein translocase subunit SecD